MGPAQLDASAGIDRTNTANVNMVKAVNFHFDPFENLSNNAFEKARNERLSVTSNKTCQQMSLKVLDRALGGRSAAIPQGAADKVEVKVEEVKEEVRAQTPAIGKQRVQVRAQTASKKRTQRNIEK